MPDPPTTEDVLKSIEAESKRLLGVIQGSSSPGPVENVYMLLLAVTKRAMSISRGFVDLTRNNNFLCAAALVRLQLDCSLRFYGVLHTSDPNLATKDFLGGKRIDRMKDSDGEQLRDGYLAKKLSEKHPWVKSVYDQASAYIHLSPTHMFAPVYKKTDAGTVLFLLTEEDVCAPPAKWMVSATSLL